MHDARHTLTGGLARRRPLPGELGSGKRSAIHAAPQRHVHGN